MNKHLSPELMNALNACIKKCEEGITECQNLISACAADRSDICLIVCTNIDGDNCAKHCGKIVKKSHEVILACQKASAACKEHNASCTDAQCSKKCQDLIDASQNCIDIAEDNEELCAVGNEKCITNCLNFIKKAQEVVNACLAHM